MDLPNNVYSMRINENSINQRGSGQAGIQMNGQMNGHNMGNLSGPQGNFSYQQGNNYGFNMGGMQGQQMGNNAPRRDWTENKIYKGAENLQVRNKLINGSNSVRKTFNNPLPCLNLGQSMSTDSVRNFNALKDQVVSKCSNSFSGYDLAKRASDQLIRQMSKFKSIENSDLDELRKIDPEEINKNQYSKYFKFIQKYKNSFIKDTSYTTLSMEELSNFTDYLESLEVKKPNNNPSYVSSYNDYNSSQQSNNRIPQKHSSDGNMFAGRSSNSVEQKNKDIIGNLSLFREDSGNSNSYSYSNNPRVSDINNYNSNSSNAWDDLLLTNNQISRQDESFAKKQAIHEFRLLASCPNLPDDKCLKYINNSNNVLELAVGSYFRDYYGSDNLNIKLVFPDYQEYPLSLSLMSNPDDLFVQVYALKPEINDPKFFTSTNIQIPFQHINRFLGQLHIPQNSKIFVRE